MAKPSHALESAYFGRPAELLLALEGRNSESVANQQDSNGRNILTVAVGSHCSDEIAADCVRILINAGARPDVIDKRNQSALHLAARLARPKCLAALLQAGADPLSPIGELDGATPIHLATWGRNMECVWLLIRAGASIHDQDAHGKTPCDIVASLAPCPFTADFTRLMEA